MATDGPPPPPCRLSPNELPAHTCRTAGSGARCLGGAEHSRPARHIPAMCIGLMPTIADWARGGWGGMDMGLRSAGFGGV